MGSITLGSIDRVFDLRDGDPKTISNLLAYRKVGVEADTEEIWV